MNSEFDIVIVGASFGGVSAARFGKHVVLLDRGGNVGGQATAQGLTRWDESDPVLSPKTYGSTKSYQVLKDDIRGWYRANAKVAPAHAKETSTQASSTHDTRSRPTAT
jgi:choline dehydrogenase-like flavoprotein